MKSCKKCGEEKPLDGFYKTTAKDGRDNTCKECRKERVRENRRENIEQYQAYERQRAMLPHRVEMRDRYLSTPEGKAAIYRGTKKYRQNNPIKMQAHNRVSHALRDGRLSRPDGCNACGDTGQRLHAHHDDYAKQLDVRWLCPGCHHQWHAKHGEALNADMDPLPRGILKTPEIDHAITLRTNP